jgi:hypothetical protein
MEKRGIGNRARSNRRFAVEKGRENGTLYRNLFEGVG